MTLKELKHEKNCVKILMSLEELKHEKNCVKILMSLKELIFKEGGIIGVL